MTRPPRPKPRRSRSGRNLNAEEVLKRVSDSYDRTLEAGMRGVNLYDHLPDAITTHPAYVHLKGGGDCSSGNPRIREFLDPKPEHKFLDLGCCVNIINYRLHEWPSGYHGVDVSPETIECLNRYVKERRIDVGALCRGPADRLPFEDGFFRIAACVGVLEYHDLDYASRVIRETARVLGPGGRFYVDIPNAGHPAFEAMCLVEDHMGRPILLRRPRTDFERILEGFFTVTRRDFSRVMGAYFLTRS